MLAQYFSVLIFIGIGVLMGVLPIFLNKLFVRTHPNQAKLSPYECGFDPFADARLPFNVRYYLVAILFIIFDLETAFLFPWAIALRRIGWPGFWAMFLFLFIFQCFYIKYKFFIIFKHRGQI